ncbi:MAG: hypothetical protein Q8K63_14690 [Acidimicrobiales bacterium]|nr:hypothetical protein [Acidimicrobiales bacterium]
MAASVALILLGVAGAFVTPDRKTTVTFAQPVRTTTTAATSTTSTSTTLPPPPPSTAPAPAAPTTGAPVVRAAAPATPTTALQPMPTLRTNAPIVPGNPAAFGGFGAWIDVYDWSAEFTGGKPGVGAAQIDHMADMGVQALYVQTAHHKSPNDIVDPHLLRPILNRARARNMRIIAWYLPTLTDTVRDLNRLLASHALGVDGMGVDIESRNVSDVNERNKRLIDLSIAFRQRVPGVPIAAIPMPAVLMEVINPNYWPGFPYREIDAAYDAWMPMGYWTSRKSSSPYRDAYRYTAENIDRLRAQLDRNNVPVHPVGGIGDVSSAADMDGFHRAAAERSALGGSVYDYRTTQADHWSILQRFRN